MVTKTGKKAVKKATKVNATKLAAARVSLTMGQALSIANFYDKAGKKVPAFLAKKLV